MTDRGDPPPTPDDLSVSESGPVAVGGSVTITGSVAAGRDIVIERLSVIADDWAPSGDAATRPGDATDVCPYPGIQPFGDAQRAWFVGRERDRRAVLDRLERSDFVAVIGGSGSGKSSLLAAGVGPDFVDARRERSETWDVRPLRPGPHPGTALQRLIESAPPAPTLWLIDQLEEVFARGVDRDERTAFLDGLCDIAAGRHGIAKVIVALRSDFYPALDEHRGIADAVAADQHRLLPLDTDSLREVILRPAELVGLRVEPALVEQVLADLEPGTNQLPLLAYAMRETWRRRRNGWLTLAGYVDAGGVNEALENGARSVWEGLSAEQRATARRVFLRLTSAGEGRAATRQRVVVDGLVTDRDDLDAVVDVLERFTCERLVVPDQDDAGRPTVDIAHEALLREWSVLRGWLDDDLDVRRLQRQLGDAAREWDEGGREPTGLFAGRRLQAVREGRRTGDITVNSTELAFVEAAEKREQRDRRRGVLLVVLPLVLVVAIVMAGVVAVQQRRTAHEKVVADALQLAAEARSRITSARDTGALLAVAAVRTDDNRTTRGTLIDAVGDPQGPLAYSRARGADAKVLAPSFTAAGSAVVGNSDGSLRLINPSTGREVSRVDTGLRSITAVAVSPDDTIVVGGDDGRVSIIPSGGGRPIVLTGPSWVIASIRFDAASGLVIAGTELGAVWRWRLVGSNVEQLPTIELEAGIIDLELSTPDEGAPVAFVATTVSGSLQRIDALTGERLPVIEGAFTGTSNVSLIAMGSQLLIQSGDGVEVRDIESGERVAPPVTYPRATSMAVARGAGPNGETPIAFTGTSSGEVQTWTLDPRPIPVDPTRAGLTGNVTAVATDGRYVVGLDEHGTVITWDVAQREAPGGRLLTDHDHTVQAVAVAAAGDIASGDADGTVVVTDVAGTSREVADLDAGVTGLAWSAPTILVAGTDEGSVWTLDTTSGEPTNLEPAGDSAIVDVLTHGPSTVVYATRSGTITVLDGNEIVRTLTAPSTPVESLALAADGETLAAGTGRPDTATGTEGPANAAVVWDLSAEGDEPIVLRGHSLQVESIAFSPSGDLLATGSDDQEIRLWSMPAGERLGTLSGHTDLVDVLAFSDDGRFLASGGEDFTIRVWDVEDQVQVGQPWRWTDANVLAMEIAEDGRSLFAAQGSNVVWWAFGIDGWVEAACELAGRDLTEQEWDELAPSRAPETLCESD